MFQLFFHLQVSSPFETSPLADTSDGTLRLFNVTRSNWALFRDATGAYQIPLNATLLIEVFPCLPMRPSLTDTCDRRTTTKSRWR